MTSGNCSGQNFSRWVRLWVLIFLWRFAKAFVRQKLEGSTLTTGLGGGSYPQEASNGSLSLHRGLAARAPESWPPWEEAYTFLPTFLLWTGRMKKGEARKKKVTVIGRMHLLTMRSKVNKQIRLQEKTVNIFYPHWGSLGNELRCCLQWRFSKVCDRTTLSVLLNCPRGGSGHRCVQLAFHIREQLELAQFTEQYLI